MRYLVNKVKHTDQDITDLQEKAGIIFFILSHKNPLIILCFLFIYTTLKNVSHGNVVSGKTLTTGRFSLTISFFNRQKTGQH